MSKTLQFSSPADSGLLPPPQLAPARTIRFCKPLSTFGLASIMEGCEYGGSEKEDAPPPRRLSAHRTPRPLVSILKRTGCGKKERRDRREGEKSIVHSFEISVIPYRSSCCRAVVCIEHITDAWVDDSFSDGQCPSCNAPCTFESSTRLTKPPTPNKVSTKSEKSFAVHWLEEEDQDTRSPSPPAPPYTPFGTDDEEYPETEHSVVLGSPLLATDMSEGFVRVTSIAGLTLFLFALLS